MQKSIYIIFGLVLIFFIGGLIFYGVGSFFNTSTQVKTVPTSNFTNQQTLITPTPITTTNTSLATKQECATATTNLLLRLNQGYATENQLVALNTVYNQSLNTCFALLEYPDKVDGGYGYDIYDTLSGKNLATKTTTGSVALVPNIHNATPADFDRYQTSLGL